LKELKVAFYPAVMILITVTIPMSVDL